MEFKEVIKRRRSTRKFLKKPIEKEKIEEILNVMNTAPSAGNLQAFRVYLIKEREKKLEIAKAALFQMFIGQAPLVLIFCALPQESAERYGKRGEELYALQDATIAATFAWLSAVSQGLSAVWVGAFEEEKVKKILNLPEKERPIIILPLGYPGEFPLSPGRKDLKEIVKEI